MFAMVRFVPGTLAPHPNAPFLNFANSIEFWTGSAPWMRLTTPSFPSCFSTATLTAAGGPSRKMCGFWCCLSAAIVGGGRVSFLVKSTGSPERAAYPAAGTPYSGFSPDATTTSPDGLPGATLENLSIATATVYGSPPRMRAAFSPFGGPGLSPTSIACAPLASCAPFGFSRLSVSEVTAGSPPPSLSRIGARSGAATSAPAATAPCQSSLSTSTIAGGRVSSELDGNTALATPAASAAGSLPLTRVVLRVAMIGKPSCSAAFLSLDFAPDDGAATGAPALDSLLFCFSEQPDSSRTPVTATRESKRGTAGESSGAA